MTVLLWILMIIFSICFLLYVVRSINKNVFLLKNAISWLFIGLGLIVFALFPQLPEWLSYKLGFQTPSNFLLFLAVIILLFMEIKNTIVISEHENKIKSLLQELSILKSKKNN